MANWANIQRLGNPADPNWQKQNLVTVEPVPGQKWQVYKGAADQFNGLIGDLVAAGYKPTSSGGFNYRNIRGSDKLSQHAFGTAFDLNAATNPRVGQGEAVITDLPANTAEIAKNRGFEWGGTWSRPDAMHFEWLGNGQSTSSLGDLVASAPVQSGAQVVSTPVQAAPIAAPVAFGDVVAPVAAPDFGSVVANYLASRQKRDEQEAADQARRAALFAQSPFS